MHEEQSARNYLYNLQKKRNRTHMLSHLLRRTSTWCTWRVDIRAGVEGGMRTQFRKGIGSNPTTIMPGKKGKLFTQSRRQFGEHCVPENDAENYVQV
eukprot:452412-Amphidinium_carterae.1